MSDTKMQTSFNIDEDRLDIKEEIIKYSRHWLWFLLSAALCISLAGLYLRYTAETYKTVAKIKILDESKGLELPMDAMGLFKGSKINLENEIEVLKSYRLLEKVVKELNLNTKYFSVGRFKTTELWGAPFKTVLLRDIDSIGSGLTFAFKFQENTISISNEEGKYPELSFNSFDELNQSDKLPFLFTILDEEDFKKYENGDIILKFSPTYSSVTSLSDKLSISPVGKSSEILSLSIIGTNRQKSEVIINAIVDQFNLDGIRDRQLVSQRTIDFVDDRFVYLAKELDSIEIDKKEFKQKNNLIYIEADAAMSLEKEAVSEEEVFKMDTQIALANLLEQSLDNEGEYSSLLPANIGLESTNINGLIGDYNTTVLERDKFISSGGENNPTVLVLNRRLKDLDNNISQSVKAYKEQLEVSLSKLTKQKRQASGVVSSMPEKEKLLRAIERQQKIKETLYLLLLQKREEAAINLAVTAPSIKVVDYGLTGRTPVSPKPKVVYMGALLLGLLLPFGTLYIKNLLDTKIHNKQDVEKEVPNVPVVAEIPFIDDDRKLFKDPHDRSVLAEAFRILSTNINYIVSPIVDSKRGKIIYTTSTIKGEGKTFVSMNLALAFASLNKKTLLVGADLRNPQIHTYLKSKRQRKGLADYLHKPELDWKELIIENPFTPNEDVLLSGTIPPNPPELLTNGRFEKFLDEVRDVYDYIIIDTAPTILVTDTLLISKHADATLFVARADYTERKLLEFSKDLIRQNKLNNVAYVVNNVGAQSSSQGYGYNYGYGYGYGADSFNRPWYKRLFGRG
ncbi:GumC family protein [Mangrovimonas aestuarii]|uniref:GumC family protein n=1 Tax=Mangrovimonas aestuarii TaxID=3018443 RepID=UPI002379C2FD|nr:tyrosine-protein kinase [Mangrovimonas aestuarii]